MTGSNNPYGLICPMCSFFNEEPKDFKTGKGVAVCETCRFPIVYDSGVVLHGGIA